MQYRHSRSLFVTMCTAQRDGWASPNPVQVGLGDANSESRDIVVTNRCGRCPMKSRYHTWPGREELIESALLVAVPVLSTYRIEITRLTVN